MESQHWRPETGFEVRLIRPARHEKALSDTDGAYLKIQWYNQGMGLSGPGKTFAALALKPLSEWLPN